MTGSSKKNTSASTLPISKISFGGATLGGLYGNITQDEAIETVRCSFKKGVSLFDVSPYYGNSEEVLGNCLDVLKEEYPRHKYLISTKVGRYGVDIFNYTRQKVRESVLHSLKLLKTSYIDIVYCHDVEFVKEEEVLEQALPELFLLKEEGLIKNVGVSGLPLEVLERIVQASFRQDMKLDAVLSYCHYTLLNDQLISSGFLTRLAENYGIKYCFNASALCMGLLSDLPPPVWHPAPLSLKEAVQNCAKECSKREEHLAHLALSYALNCPSKYLTSTIIGFSRPLEVLQAFKSFDSVKLKQLDPLQKLCQEILRPHYNITWPSPPPSFKRQNS